MAKMVNKKTNTTKKSKSGGVDVSRTFIGTPEFPAPNKLWEIFRDLQSDNLNLDEEIPLCENKYTLREVLPFIESKFDFKVLANLLRENQELLAHPIVWSALQHRHKFHNLIKGKNSKLPDEEIDSHIQTMAEGWVQGLLPGYRVVQPKKPRSRPALGWREENLSQVLLRDYEDTLKIIQQFKLQELYTDCDKAAWETRLVMKTIPKIWERSKLKMGRMSEYSSTPGHRPITSWSFTISKKPLPYEKVESWAKEITGPNGPTSPKQLSGLLFGGFQLRSET